MNGRRDFLKFGAGALALSAARLAMGECAAKGSIPAFAKGAEEMGPILKDSEVAMKDGIAGKRASFFIDDTIWCFRDLTRLRPKSMFDNPFFAPLKECHEKFGLKLQLNIFYRTDFFYGLDEFTLADMTDAYKAEWQANKDWLKLGFHSLQEFPDYPWINIDYGDVKKLFGMIRGEVERFFL